MKKNTKILIIVFLALIIALLLYLLLTGQKYEVTFDTDGGSLVDTQLVNRSDLAVRPDNPTKDGYVFDDWYLNDEIFDFNTPIKKDTYLKAKWVIGTGARVEGDFVVTFDSGNEEITTVGVFKNELVTKPIDPEREGYEFVAWQLNDEDFDFTTPITEDITLKAKWKKVEEEIPVESVSLAESANIEKHEVRKLILTIKPKNATNKKATWKSANPSIATVDNNGNVKGIKPGDTIITATLDGKTAQCKVHIKRVPSFEVSFDLNGNGSGTNPNNQNREKRLKASKPPTPTDEYYEFVAWQDENGNNYNFNTPITKDIRLKAKWKPACLYTIKNIPNGSESLPEIQSAVTLSCKGQDKTAQVKYLTNANNVNLGEYSSSQKVIVVKSSETGSIKKARMKDGKLIDIQKK